MTNHCCKTPNFSFSGKRCPGCDFESDQSLLSMTVDCMVGRVKTGKPLNNIGFNTKNSELSADFLEVSLHLLSCENLSQVNPESLYRRRAKSVLRWALNNHARRKSYYIDV